MREKFMDNEMFSKEYSQIRFSTRFGLARAFHRYAYTYTSRFHHSFTPFSQQALELISRCSLFRFNQLGGHRSIWKIGIRHQRTNTRTMAMVFVLWHWHPPLGSISHYNTNKNTTKTTIVRIPTPKLGFSSSAS